MGWLIPLVGLVVWLRLPPALLREQLKLVQFWSLEMCVLLVLLAGGSVPRDITRRLNRRDGIGLAGLAALAVSLTVFVAPRTNRIYYDEQIYQSIGQNLSDLKRAQMCHDGTVEYGRLQCWNGEYNKQPYAWPHLLSLAYRLFGVSNGVAFVVNAIAMALTVVGVYLLTVILFSDSTAAFFAGLLLSLLPQQIVWSATAASEPPASLACVAALVSAAWFQRSRSTPALFSTGILTAYAVQFRPESFVVVPVVGLLLWERVREEWRRPRLWAAGLLAFALLSVHLAHMFAVRNESWGTSDARLSFGYVLANLQVNGRFYLGDERFPLIVTLLALVGMFASPLDRARRTLAAYFLSFFGIYLLFYAGSYNYGADVRYSLMTYPPVAVLAGLGAARLQKWAELAMPAAPATALVTASLLFQFLWYAPLVRATTEEAWAARADVGFARSVAAGLPRNSYVLTHNPGMFQVWGVNAGQISLAVTNPRQLDFLLQRYAGGVYLHWNFWCNVQDPIQQDFCQQALAQAAVQSVQESRVRDQRFALYRILSVVR